MNRFLKMNRFFKSCLLASAGLVMLAITLSFTTPGRAFAQRIGEDCVRICDTASSPIHVIVQGITRVTGEVTINNENAIATTVTGPVQVTTSRGEPLLVAFPKLKLDDIFQEQVSLTLNPGQTLATKDFVVPANKYLEIKSASGTVVDKSFFGNLPPQGTGFWLVKIRVIRINNNIFDFPFFRQFQGFSNAQNGQSGGVLATYQVGGNQLGIFADTVDAVQVRFERFGPFQIESKLELAISGEYHDL